MTQRKAYCSFRMDTTFPEVYTPYQRGRKMLSKMRLWVRGLGMPTYHNVNYRGESLLVRPIGWRRWLRFYPYSQGNIVKFRIGLKDKSKETMPPIAIYEDVPLAESSTKDRYPLIASTFQEQMSGNKFKYLDVKGTIMSVWGRGRYTINNPTEKDAIEIVTFKILADATMFMWLTPTIIAIIGTIASIVLWVFIKPKM